MTDLTDEIKRNAGVNTAIYFKGRYSGWKNFNVQITNNLQIYGRRIVSYSKETSHYPWKRENRRRRLTPPRSPLQKSFTTSTVGSTLHHDNPNHPARLLCILLTCMIREKKYGRGGTHLHRSFSL